MLRIDPTTKPFAVSRGLLLCRGLLRCRGLLLCAALLSTLACGTPGATTTGGSSDTGAPDDVAAVDAASDDAAGTDTDVVGDDVADVLADVVDAVEDAVQDATTDAAVADVPLPDVTKDIVKKDVQDIAVEDAGPITKQAYPTACSAASDCQLPCATGACVGGKCSFSVKANACLVPSAPGEVTCYGAGLPDDITPCLACVPSIATNKLSSVTGILALSAPGEGVAVSDTAAGGIVWGYDSKRFVSPPASLYFGDPATHTYANGKHVSSTATLPKIAIPKTAGVSPSLSFWLWLDTEASPGFDVLTVNVIDGAATVPVWSSDPQQNTTHGAWQRVTLDVSAWAGQSLTLQFAFDTQDASVNAFEGVYIDDVEVSSGCCASVADCDDGNACSVDSCAMGVGGTPACQHAPKEDCCNSAGDCNDGKPCTLDLCPTAGGTCSHSAKIDCCMSAGDCDDADTCTVDTCTGAGGGCKHQNTCCSTDGECQSADPCLVGACSSGTCTFQSICCKADGDCDDFNPCTNDTCEKGSCVHAASSAPGCCAPNLITANFDGSTGAMDLTSTSSQLMWHYAAVPDSVGGIGVLAFGDPNASTYSVPLSAKPKAVASTPLLTLLANNETSLGFSYRADTISSSYTLRVFVVIDGTEVTLASKSITSGSTAWQTVNVDLSPVAGKSFAVQFEVTTPVSFGSITNTQVYVDNIHVDSTCLPKKCTSTAACGPSGYTLQCYTGVCTDGVCGYPYSCCDADGDCNDGGLCTTDKCVNKKCQFQPIKNCCMGNNDCDDKDPCTSDSCAGPGAQCSFASIAGCCTTSAQCDDKNSCTADTCTKNVCKNAQTCCTADADCADGETKCTTDTCVNKVCQHKGTGAAGCCEANTFTNDFDAGDAKDMTFANSAGPTQGWQLWGASPNAVSGTGVLYYGDPAASNYNFGNSNGTASLTIALNAEVASSLTLDLFMETESSSSYDNLTISVEGTQVWTKGSANPPMGTWTTVTADLSQWQGKTVTLKFDFATMDSVANSTFGVAIDNLKIVAKCP